jgi:hypothetical protein
MKLRRTCLALTCLGCSAAPGRDVKVVPANENTTIEASEPTPPSPAASAGWPDRNELLIAYTLEHQLLLRSVDISGLTPFVHELARRVREDLYDAERELLWFTDQDDRLWVIDLRSIAANQLVPVPIARNLPQHSRLAVSQGEASVVGDGQLGDETMELVLHWESEPWIDGGEGGGRIDDLEGRAWLDLERSRTPRGTPAWVPIDIEDPHVKLPPGIAQCDSDVFCGAARPFGTRGWQLVVAKNDTVSGDFTHNGCLLYDPARQAFARPPEATEWAPVVDTELDTCGPYRFNQDGTAFVVSDKICRIGAGCRELDAFSRGWIVPGETVGTE